MCASSIITVSFTDSYTCHTVDYKRLFKGMLGFGLEPAGLVNISDYLSDFDRTFIPYAQPIVQSMSGAILPIDHAPLTWSRKN